MADKQAVTLIWPGAQSLFQPMLQQLQTRSFRNIIRKARFQPSDAGYEQLLFAAFGVPLNARQTDLPAAQLRASAPALCADPCYLYPDRDQLRLFASPITLTQTEADSLITAIQPLFDDIQAQLVATTADQWTLVLKAPIALQNHALSVVEGLGVIHYLPTGEDSRYWLRLWNEIQMVLFEHPVNQQREAAGKLPVNGVWFWGNCQAAIVSPWQQVTGSERLLDQLCTATATAQQPQFSKLMNGQQLIVLPTWSIEAGTDSLAELEQQFWQPLWQALRCFRLSQLNVWIPGQGQYQLPHWKSWL